MIFKNKDVHELIDLGYTEIMVSDDNEYWMARYKLKYGMYYLRYGKMWNWHQYIFDVCCKRNQLLYFELSKMLLYIAEHSEQPLEKILPCHLTDLDSEKFSKQAFVTSTAIKLRMESKSASVKKKNGSKRHATVAAVELVIEKDVPMNGQYKEKSLPISTPPNEIIPPIGVASNGRIEFMEEETRPQEKPAQQEVVPTEVDGKDDSEAVTLYAARELNHDSYLEILANVRPAKPARNEYAHISYDLLLEVEIKRDKTIRAMARTSFPKYTIELGRFFRMYPGDHTKDFRSVLVGSRGEAPNRETFLLFDNALLKQQWPDDVRDLPASSNGRKWQFEDRKLGEYILEAIGKKPQSILGSKKIYKLRLEPLRKPGAKPEDKMELKDVRDFIVADVKEKIYIDGNIPDQDRDMPSDLEIEPQE